MTNKLEALMANLETVFGADLRISHAFGQITAVVKASDYLSVMRQLRDEPSLRFEQLLDLCGVDYSACAEEAKSKLMADQVDPTLAPARFAAVLQLISITHNWRLCVKVFAPNNEFPVLPSIVQIWNSADWYEREAFDLFGLVFDGHPDLRRILTDYGFIGHPFRKDFPVSGYVEMRYDPEQKRVVYQPVTIEPREIIPRVIREDGYGGLKPGQPH
ncbi:MAG: NADH-quinone oxidoreductase subunit C [Glomeribacter sp. 1016415]|uniref:NADH-quinone oxidoreductase subunit C n=1 Tax=Mycoavidus cysteinexigens TaxID=1553431 RepID=A0A2Z6EWP6_9BURK|nr:NADH-quinone oxidoreductase subunit C [Mycoavidus cysteinexigens]MCX8566657.1 NADH-quinone oxidoreductase subunit C [Glomeribacter sp. 1016415]BBE09877.1 NADH dehydrogenase I chain c protein [Mycoavidus cysteinexigens]GAM53774.1 NADH-ubiquinone oxidoreductase chain C [bacterium endosymbiont of Mortierella elongata FMR23-6]GLR02325.1 NADH-quinone oxidoreductase subunit C [Mycoavidus cysteinexigens]